MVEMTVVGLAIDATSRNPIVLLRDPSGLRQVPIWIDHAQAHNIISGMQKSSSQRPLTHDLIISLMNEGHLNLKRVIIHSIEENSFQAVLKIQLLAKSKEKESNDSNSHDKDLIEIEARPSDAIALAVRKNCSIWMLEEVVAEASIPVDANADAEDQNKFRQFIEDVSPAALVRHLKSRDSNSNKGEDHSESEEE